MTISQLFSTIALASTLLLSSNVFAQKFPKLDKSPMDAAVFPIDYKISDKLIKIIYSRPQLKDRKIGSKRFLPYGKVWRTGANEAAELTLFTDMKLGETKVKAGTYTFYIIPNEKEWTAIINTDTNVWGSYFYDESKDVGRLTVPVNTADESLESFSIVFKKSDNGVHMHLGFGKTRIAIPFTK